MEALVLTVHYGGIASTSESSGHLAVRSFKFDPESLVSDAVHTMLTRHGSLMEGYVEGQESLYGLYVPPSSQYQCSGWLRDGCTLRDSKLQSGNTVDVHLKEGRQLVLLDARLKNPRNVEYPSDMASVKRNVVMMVRALFQMNQPFPVMPPNVNTRVTLIPKQGLLLDYDMPPTAMLVLSATPNWQYSDSTTDSDIIENVDLYVTSPWKEGTLYNKCKIGLKKGWRPRWAVLERDSLVLKEEDKVTPLVVVSLQNVMYCHQCEPIDNASRKFGYVIKIGTKKKTIYLGTNTNEELLQWLHVFDEWMRYKHFFKPKVIKSRGHALSSMLQEGPRGKEPGNARPRSSRRLSNNASPGEILSAASAFQHKLLDGLEKVRERSDTLSHSENLEVQPNRSVCVMCCNAPTRREMIVDSRLDVYELAYMIAEEIMSENAMLMELEDHGPLRAIELLDHQESLASQNVPLSAVFMVKKTGVVDDFVQENDIYDNHFLYVALPTAACNALIRSDSGEWSSTFLMLTAGWILALSDPDNIREDNIRACIPLTDLRSIQKSEELSLQFPALSDYSVAIEVASGKTLHMFVEDDIAASEWHDLDAWYGFFRPNPVDHQLFTGELPSDELWTDGELTNSSPFQWLGVEEEVPLAAEPQVEIAPQRIKQYDWKRSSDAKRETKGRSQSIGDDVDLDEPVVPFPNKPIPMTPKVEDATVRVRRVYECMDPVQLRSLSSDDPSPYVWKVTHSLNLNVLGYAALDLPDIVFYNCFDNELLRLPRTELAGLKDPKKRLSALNQRKAVSTPDTNAMARIRNVFNTNESVILRKIKDAEFGFRVILPDSTHIGWANKNIATGLFTFFDRNGNPLVYVPIREMQSSQKSSTPTAAANKNIADQIAEIFGFPVGERIKLTAATHDKYSHRALRKDSHIGFGDRETFNYSFYDTAGQLLKKLPLISVREYLNTQARGHGKTNQTAGVGKKLADVIQEIYQIRGRIILSPSTDTRYTDCIKSQAGRHVGWGDKNTFDYIFYDLEGELLRKVPMTKASKYFKETPEVSRSSSNTLKIFRSSSKSDFSKAVKKKQQTRKKAMKEVDVQPDANEDDESKYVPDGISPELLEEGYDAESKHRPMGIAGLLGEPPSSDDDE